MSTFRRILQTVVPILTLILLVVATAYAEHLRKGSSTFLKPENLVNIFQQWGRPSASSRWE